MASAPQQQPAVAPPVGVVERSIAALGLLVAAAIIYAMLGSVGLVPLPASLALVHRWAHEGGRMRLVVSGYYRIASAFAPPAGPPGVHELATAPSASGADSVFVVASPDDLVEGKIVAIIDTATGSGTRPSPFVVHTVSGYGRFVAAVTIGALIACGFAYWVAGTVVALARRRT